MKLWWPWIIGLIGLAIAGTASGQKEEGDKPASEAGAEANSTDTSTRPPLTGNPQIDYKFDPNLPHELRGYDLSDYPFYSKLPEDLLEPTFNFTCDDRHDGFYASVPHKCQVYHNCLFGQRYDFLCANYTVFDQKNFICHYVSEVDCANSAKHYDRNDELYETTTTTTTTQKPQIIFVERPRPLRGQGLIRPKRPRPFGGIKRRPGNRRTTTTPAPVYYDDYYYDEYYDQYYDDYYNDYISEKTTTTTTTTTPRPRRPKPKRKRLGGQGQGQGGGQRQPGRPGGVFSVSERKRPRINPPVPLDDELSVQGPRSSRLQQASPSRQQTLDYPTDEPVREAPSGGRRGRPGRKPRPGVRPQKKTTTTTTTTTTEAVPEDEYYDYYYDYADETSSSTTTTTTTTERPARPQRQRVRGQQRGQQNRPSQRTTTTTEPPPVEAPRDQTGRPSRVNLRRNPVSSRRTPVERTESQNEPQDPVPTQEVAESGRPASQRLRPQFPRNRPSSVRSNIDTVEEEPPIAPEVELPSDEPLLDETPPETPVSNSNRRTVSRVPIRRLGQGGPRRGEPRQERRGQGPRPDPDYYYDY